MGGPNSDDWKEKPGTLYTCALIHVMLYCTGEGVGGANSDDWRKHGTLYTMCPDTCHAVLYLVITYTIGLVITDTLSLKTLSSYLVGTLILIMMYTLLHFALSPVYLTFWYTSPCRCCPCHLDYCPVNPCPPVVLVKLHLVFLVLVILGL